MQIKVMVDITIITKFDLDQLEAIVVLDNY